MKCSAFSFDYVTGWKNWEMDWSWYEGSHVFVVLVVVVLVVVVLVDVSTKLVL